MTKQDFVDKLRRHDAWIEGKVLKLDFTDEGIVLVDGMKRRISEEDGPAESTLRISWSDWLALSDGELDPMRAYMSGRLRIEGELSAAIELGSLFKQLRG